MSDGAHLLIPFASSSHEGCVEARRGLKLPNLEKLLARLTPAGADEAGEDTLSMPHERALSRIGKLEAPDGCIPWAAWQVAQEGRKPGKDAWAWITPCFWQVGQDHVAMAHPQDLHLAAIESEVLLAAMRPYFEEDGIALEYHAPTLWVARGEVFRDFPTASLDRVIGRMIDPWLPRGDHAKAVRRLQQEMQMLLYTHPVNEDRARRNLAPVNSFWVSATGVLTPSAIPRPPGALHVPQSLRDAALRQDWRAWASAWRHVDAREGARVLEALDAGEEVSVTLCGERSARAWAGRGNGFFAKLAASWRGGRLEHALASL